MDLGLSEQQEMLKKSARDFLQKECPKQLVRQLDASDTGYSPELWKKMAELGWLGLAFPEEYGGNGGSFLDLAVLLEEMGYSILPGHFFSTVVLGGLAILAAGSAQQKKSLLPKIAAGELILTLALTEPSAKYDAVSIKTRATAQNDEYVINGTKLFVPDANVAHYMLCVTRTQSKKNAEGGITVFLVDSKSPGIKCTLLKTLARDKQCEVIFDNVHVPKENIVGKLNKGWPIVSDILQKATAAKCMEMVGGAQAALEMAVNYAKERVQFNRPIGSFQAIQHYCANMVTDVDGSRFIAYKAAWKVSEGLPATYDVAVAKAWTGEAYARVTLLAHQIFGAIGFTMDHDIHLYYRRAKAGEISFGDGDFQRAIVAQELGL
ncbi:MAG: acyl-CoA dehydrogenase [Chloroflexi bacterium]|nr:acyl-CoA dehydrogenase [Chloroflexota bacterium]MBM3172955.1 acyl-CoA dehydrogenase [Chloroflexota bacterium]MBM3175842.1 acyl-CoA dehydrogenase [Chloroflexota bacterium]MBM4450287.1 acyl-CoA dehydrogenase [Chloroflexota bacterium]